MSRKVIISILTIIFSFSCVSGGGIFFGGCTGSPASATPDDGKMNADGIWYGSGTEDDPYLIMNSADLLNMVYDDSIAAGDYFLQVADIDLSGISEWTPIGNSSVPFLGIYDGGGYSISNLTISSGSDYSGLFGYISGATIMNVNLKSANVKTTQPWAASLVSWAEDSTIKYCTVDENSIVGNYSANYGGLVGRASSCEILYCSSAATINVLEYAGGIVYSLIDGLIQDCFFSGTIQGSYAEKSGGIAYGSSNSSIINCYNKGTINADRSAGIVYSGASESSVENCYNVGTLSGTKIYGICYSCSSVTFSNVYWDTDCGATTAVSSGSVDGVTGLADLDTDSYALNSTWSFYKNWDFSETWTFVSGMNDGYPVLKWSLEKSTVSFDENGGDGTAPSAIEELPGTTVTLPSTVEVTRVGYEFNGWNLTAESKTDPDYARGASFVVEEDVTLYINWSPISVAVNCGFKFLEDFSTNKYVEGTKDGFSYDVIYESLTLSGNSTTSTQTTIAGGTISFEVRAYQSIQVENLVRPASGWIITGIVLGSNSPSSTFVEEPTSLTVELKSRRCISMFVSKRFQKTT